MRDNLVIIIPSCLRVERAITFFMSVSISALRPDIIMVEVLNTKSLRAILGLEAMEWLIRISR